MATISRFDFKAVETSRSLTAKVLRDWCAPQLILAVTNLSDEDTLLFHVIRQARRTTAKVLLAHVLEGRPSRVGLTSRTMGIAYSADFALRALERMAYKLRWVGIPCEPVLLKGDPAEEILDLAKSRAVHRILLTVRSEKRPLGRILPEEIAPWAGMPVCVVCESESPVVKCDRPVREITLALSLHSDCDTSLAFAARLAQEHDAGLTLLHVIEEGEDSEFIEQAPEAIASLLPAGALREAELLCPLEIVVRRGDPAREILRYGADTNQDFIILGAPQSPCALGSEEVSVAHRVLNETRCPAIMLGPSHARWDTMEVASIVSGFPHAFVA